MKRAVQLDCDEDCEEHIGRHGVSALEADQVFYGPSEVRQKGNVRLIVGQTRAGRYLVLVCAFSGLRRARLITARELNEREKSALRRRRAG